LLAGLKDLAGTFAVLYGDVMVNVDLGRIWQRHLESGADATLLLHPNDHPQDSDLVEANGEWITAFHNRPHPADRWFQNLVNAGLYVLQRSVLENFDRTTVPGAPAILDFGKDLFPAVLKRGARLLAYNTPEFIKDIGTPQRYDRICAQYAAGVVQRSSLCTAQRAVFLDRDGTLVPDKDCLRNAEGLELFPGAAEAVNRLNQAGWRAVVVTNQPVIAKGWCDEAEMQRIHNKLESLLGREHAFLDRIYYCPHHPDAGFEGERRELKIRCDCRKPATGMIQAAVRDLNIDLAQSWLIGDSTTDLQTAKNAGLKSILVRTGCAGRDGKYPVRPDFVFDSLGEAVNFIIQQPSE
jgi:histidinol-phosphate phosphatase family protein